MNFPVSRAKYSAIGRAFSFFSGFAGDDHRAGIDIAGGKACLGIALLDKGANLFEIDPGWRQIGRQQNRRGPQHLALRDDELGGMAETDRRSVRRENSEMGGR